MGKPLPALKRTCTKCISITKVFLITLAWIKVHERSDEMDFLLLVLRKLLHSNSRHVKVTSASKKHLRCLLCASINESFLGFFWKIILMSATINCREFAEYFSTPVWGKMTPAYVFEVEGAPFTIEEFYLDDLQKLHPYRVKRPKHKHSILLFLFFLNASS